MMELMLPILLENHPPFHKFAKVMLLIMELAPKVKKLMVDGQRNAKKMTNVSVIRTQLENAIVTYQTKML
jgi:hypothetical protein